MLIDELLSAYDLTQEEAAHLLKISRVNFNRLINAHHHLSPAMALKVAKFTGTEARDWLEMQTRIDLIDARRRLGLNLDQIVRFK